MRFTYNYGIGRKPLKQPQLQGFSVIPGKLQETTRYDRLMFSLMRCGNRDIYNICPTVSIAPQYLSTLHITYTNESENPSIEMAAAHGGVEAARVAASVK